MERSLIAREPIKRGSGVYIDAGGYANEIPYALSMMFAPPEVTPSEDGSGYVHTWNAARSGSFNFSMDLATSFPAKLFDDMRRAQLAWMKHQILHAMFDGRIPAIPQRRTDFTARFGKRRVRFRMRHDRWRVGAN